MSINLNDGFNILNFDENIYNFNLINKSIILVKLKLFDMILNEKFYYDCRIDYIENYLIKYFMIDCKIYFKFNNRDLKKSSKLFENDITNGSIINVIYTPIKFLFLKDDKVFHNSFESEMTVLNLDISIKSIKLFYNLINLVNYYNIKMKSLNFSEVKKNYSNLNYFLVNLDDDVLNDIIILLNNIKNENYRILLGNIINYLFYLKKIEIKNNKIVKRNNGLLINTILDDSRFDNIIDGDTIVLSSYLDISISPIKNIM